LLNFSADGRLEIAIAAYKGALNNLARAAAQKAYEDGRK
jgi:hypothetical protein